MAKYDVIDLYESLIRNSLSESCLCSRGRSGVGEGEQDSHGEEMAKQETIDHTCERN